MTRAIAGIVMAFILAIVAAHVAYRATAQGASHPVNHAWEQDRLRFVAWNEGRWSARLVGDAFMQVPASRGNRSRHLNRSIAYVDWHGEPWQAKVDGDEFLLAHRGNWNGGVERSSAIHYLDWNGERQLRTVTQLRR